VPAGWFEFRAGHDSFGPSPIDLRAMNEPRAGDGGFIQARGDIFVHQKTGQPIRFWGVNVRPRALEPGRADLDRLARFLAKRGVNLVRLAGPLWRDDDPTQIDLARLDRVHALIAALARQGIYLALSTYWPIWMRPKGGPAFEGYDGSKFPFGICFFSPAFQELQRSWFTTILTAANPYTGVPLARDPALAMVEVLNEDSLFFWTFEPYDTLPAAQMRILEQQFGRWLARAHGSLAAAFAGWGGRRIRGDDEQSGRAGFLPLAELVKRSDARARETAAFLAEIQRSYFDAMVSHIKRDLGFAGSVTASNWVTADARRLGPLDKWSNLGADFMDHHGYFEGPHEGERAGWSLSAGDRYNDALALRFETGKGGRLSFDLPIADFTYNGQPSTVSEIGWLPPNRYRTDLPLLAASYGLLQGTDGFMFFTVDDDDWTAALDKFSIANPATMGQFPAAAVVYRRGLVKQADAVVRVVTSTANLDDLQGIPLAPPESLEHFRAQDVPANVAGTGTATPQIDPLAYLVGRVDVQIDAGAGPPSTFADVTRFIDRRAGQVRSVTGELIWDWRRGVATVDAPAAQGATGLLRQAGPIALHDITIASRNDYAAVLAVALDQAPLAKSKHILLQVVTEDSNSGWSAPGEGMRAIDDVGGAPVIARSIAGHVIFGRPDAAALTVTPLDFNGYPAGAPFVLGKRRDLSLEAATLYYVLTAGPTADRDAGFPIK
jgi:hypothetical protein